VGNGRRRNETVAKVKNVEKKIWNVEGFDVIIRHEDGKDARGDLAGLPQYPYERAAKDDMTIARWVKNRFSQTYPGYTVDVIDGNGEARRGNVKLGSVRDSYEEA